MSHARLRFLMSAFILCALGASLPARAELACNPRLAASKGTVRIKLCVDATGTALFSLTNSHRKLDAVPEIVGCKVTFSDGKSSVVSWRQLPIPPRGESRESFALFHMPLPSKADCEIERVDMSDSSDANPPLRADAPSLVGSRLGSEPPRRAAPQPQASAPVVISPQIFPQLSYPQGSGQNPGAGAPSTTIPFMPPARPRDSEGRGLGYFFPAARPSSM